MQKTKTFLFFMLITALLQAQSSWHLQVSSVIEKDDRGLAGATVELFEGNKLVKKTLSDADGYFSVDIPDNGEFILKISYQDCNSKFFTVSTNGVPETVRQRDNNKMTMKIGGVTMKKPLYSIDYSALKQPMAKIVYDPVKKKFGHDETHTDHILRALDAIREAERILLEKHMNAIKAGDAALKKNDCPLAQKNYKTAVDLIPEAPYDVSPRTKLAQADNCIKEKEKAELARAAKEKQAAELAAKAAAEKEAAELAAKQKAEEEARLKNEKLAREQEAKAKEAAELAARQKAEEETRLKNEKLAREHEAKAKEAAELAARQKAEEETRLKNEKLAKEQEAKAKEAAELVAKQKAEEEIKLKNEKLAGEKQAREKEAAEFAEKEKQEKESAEKSASEEDKKKTRSDKDKKQNVIIPTQTAQREGETGERKQGKSRGSIPRVLGAAEKYKETIKTADAYFKMKRWEEAKTAYLEALEYKEGDPYATQRLADIEATPK